MLGAVDEDDIDCGIGNRLHPAGERCLEPVLEPEDYVEHDRDCHDDH
jgi:hypothetical protein